MKKLFLLLVLFGLIFNNVYAQRNYTAKKLLLIGQIQKPYINYGYIYNAFAALDSRKITSSDDWIVPYYTDLNYNQVNSLFYYLGGSVANTGKLKSTGLTYWNTPNTGATNELWFNGRGGGLRNGATGEFSELNISLNIHSTFTSGTDNRQYVLATHNSSTSINNSGGWGTQKNGRSIRLVYVGSGTPTNYIGNDNKIYRIVLIGTQYWLADNLAETKYRNGDLITVVTDNAAWAALTTEARCVYNNDESYR